ncbi:MAG: hypothetical protein B1H09_08480 [Gemmatimonadaceae bacterium 4484_173]|nr:MAG: hypothetical protein B1H09_08480 [Gemmatimonadaceae bacterium 4484_173]
MSLIVALCVAVISTGIDTDTPEEFLTTLASSPAEIWIESQLPGDNTIHPDTVTAVIGSRIDLSVDPGGRVLEDVEGGYRVLFPESRWTWRMDGGRIGSVRGQSVIEWHPGGYSWVAVPVFTEQGASIGRRESLCMGVTAMLAIGVIGILAIWYAKRRYGS